MWFSESLRLLPPVYSSGSVHMKRDVTVNGLKIRAGDIIGLHLTAYAKDPEQWQKPNEFLPDRFDPHHELYLTPSGKKRNPFAFSPFFGGHRICLGKTFVEEVSKLTFPVLMKKFKFRLNDASNFELPFNCMH